MAVCFKTFIQILMTVLALGAFSPESACAAGASETGQTCCCTGSPICTSHSDQPCKQSCPLIRVQAFDKQVPARTALASSPRGNTLLFSIAPTKIKYFVPIPIAHRWELNALPSFSGSPPQAMLCLWLI